MNGFTHRWRVRWLLCLVALVASLFALFHFGSTILRGLDSKAAHYRTKLGGRLNGRHQLIFYSSLDGAHPFNAVSGKPVLAYRCPVTEGVVGGARSVDDDKKAFLQTDVAFGFLPAHVGTLAFWWKDRGTIPQAESRILWSGSQGGLLGIRSLDGRLEVIYTATNGQHSLSVPFQPDGRFHHIALTMGPGEVGLFVDGALAATKTVPGGLSLPYRLITFGGDPRIPLHAALDEIAIWSRPLSAREIWKLARTRIPLATRYEPVVSALVRALETGRSFFQIFFRCVDRLVPSKELFPPLNSEVPALEIHLSKKDSRHFRHAYDKCILRGERTDKAADFRTISISFQGKRQKVEACLDDLAAGEVAARRYSFLLKGPPGFLGTGSGLVRVYPPERYPVLHRAVPMLLPLSRKNVVRFFIQGDFQGYYLLEPMDRIGGAWVMAGQRNARRKDFVFFDSQPALETEAKALPMEEVDRRSREMSSFFRADIRFPWSSQEVAWRTARHSRDLALQAFAKPEIVPADLAGANPSAFYVVTNLDLTACGPGVRWTSSRPDLIAPDGSVRRPDGDLAEVVELTGVFPDGKEKRFRFRVIATTPRLPALHLHFTLPLEKNIDRDFTCLRYPAGGLPPRWLTGTVGAGAGVHHRGNTSYVRAAKRSMSLEFDEEIDAGVTARPCRHLLLLSGYADPTRLRNKLAFDAFHQMRGLDVTRRSPAVSWSEVFVNGEYAGLWEIASRMQDAVGDSFSQMFKIRVLNGLWSRSEPDFLTFVGKPPFAPDTFAGVEEVSRFVLETEREAFLDGVRDYFDLEELADFLLLVNMTGNLDGRVTNQYLARRKEDGRWECLPWDYDKTFMVKSSRTAWLSNPLLARLEHGSSEFMELVRTRWRAHRSGPLSDERVLGWIDEQEAFLAPYMEEEFRLLQPIDTTGDFKDQVGILRSEAAFRLHQLDDRLEK